MLHHLSLGVRDLDAAAHFHDAALAALGFRRVFDNDEAIGYGLIDDEDTLGRSSHRGRLQGDNALTALGWLAQKLAPDVVTLIQVARAP
ncbi:hypothetical protein [Stenotrophomonas sp.]|uniref:hypothetical protein n=1 Tax=Stenotrophomonas sp. TaxID=69392 RepID=UPI00289F4D13|nr:hypothetical protein [Stenotrophomonas sp.]